MDSSFFCTDYFQAREAFAAAVRRLDGDWEAIPISDQGPDQQILYCDVGTLGQRTARRQLLVTSGLHGVEGWFGSAGQMAMLDYWQRSGLPADTRVVVAHVLNPFGMVWNRRTDEVNIDLNRNFRLPDRTYVACDPLYRKLHDFLNPQKEPSGYPLFLAEAGLKVLKYGLEPLREAIGKGQYEYPEGLFFGGRYGSATVRMIADWWNHWLGESQEILHLDLHTGLGKQSGYKLLGSPAMSEQSHKRWAGHFGQDVVEATPLKQTGYSTQGDFGNWGEANRVGRDYQYFCAEFGTYSPTWMLHVLRQENFAHYHLARDDPHFNRAKQQINDAFCPASPAWRAQAIEGVQQLSERVSTWAKTPAAELATFVK